MDDLCGAQARRWPRSLHGHDKPAQVLPSPPTVPGVCGHAPGLTTSWADAGDRNSGTAVRSPCIERRLAVEVAGRCPVDGQDNDSESRALPDYDAIVKNSAARHGQQATLTTGAAMLRRSRQRQRRRTAVRSRGRSSRAGNVQRLALPLWLRLEAQRHRVDAVAPAGGMAWPVVEQMAEVGAAALAEHLGTDHTVRAILG